jgi:hypothetical protein
LFGDSSGSLVVAVAYVVVEINPVPTVNSDAIAVTMTTNTVFCFIEFNINGYFLL